MAFNIRQPENTHFEVNGTTSGTLEWNRSFAQEWNARYVRAQRFVDSEVLRLGEKYIPFRQGDLKRSGIRGTVIGSGLVRYIAPYARYQYGGRVMVGAAPKRLTNIPLQYHSGDPNRGAKWFEVVKARHGGQIISGAKQIIGGRG